MLKYSVLLLTCLVLVFPALGQKHSNALEKELETKMSELVKQHNLPGMTLAIVFGDEQKINLAAGLADKEAGIKMQPQDRMLAGSVGKMFVSAVALQLVSDAKISLSAKLKDYLGERDWYRELPNGEDITIRDLMQHTSGIPRYIFQPEFLESIRQQPLLARSPEDCIAYVLNKTALHAVGKGWGYSDTNYLLLGLVIEQVSGQSYYSLLEKSLLKPLKLKATSPSTDRELKGLVQGYIGSQNFFDLPKQMLQDGKLAVNPAFEWTGGGVVTNVADLASWARLLHKGEVIAKELYPELTQAVSMQSGEDSDSGYGLGTFVWLKQGDIRYGHAGFFPGYLSQVEYSTNEGYAIAIQINTDEGYPLLAQFIHTFDQIIASHEKKGGK